MASRQYAAGIIVFFCIALMLVPNETFGRTAGSGGSGGSSAGSVTSGGRSANSSGRVRHHRRFGTGFYSPGYVYPVTVPSEQRDLPLDNNPNPAPNVLPEAPSTPRRVNYIEYHMGCHTETVTVPWDNGKEHSVNIVRCLR